MIRRCLEPEPSEPLSSRGRLLAADLQAVADDLPLEMRAVSPGPAARPAGSAAAAAGSPWPPSSCLPQPSAPRRPQRPQRTYQGLRARPGCEYNKGIDAYDERRLPHRQDAFEQRRDLADRHSQNAWGSLTRLTNFRQLGSLLTDKLKIFDSPKNLEEMRAHSHQKIDAG